LRLYRLDSYRIVVPEIFGTEASYYAAPGAPDRMEKLWTYELLVEEFKRIDDPVLRQRLLELLDRAKNKSVLCVVRRKQPLFRIRNNKKDKPIITVYPNGRMDLYVGPECGEEYYPDPSMKQELVKELTNLGMLSPSDIARLDKGEVKYSIGTARSIADLSDEEFKRLLEVFEKVCLLDDNQ